MHWNAQLEPSDVPEEAVQHLVPMRDGVRLATDVYLPEPADARAQAFPTVLVRLPYDKNSRYVFMLQIARRLNARGYVLVVQDVRGKYRSEGLPLGPSSESRDGYDTIDWVSKQAWCDGRVGMFGDSYYGFTQWAALSSQHPSLRAIVPRVTSTAIGSPRPQHDVPWMVHADYLARCWTGPYVYEEGADVSIAPLTDAFDRHFERVGRRSLWYDLSLPHEVPVPTYPDGHPYDVRPLPTLHCVGWFDNLLIGSMRDYVVLSSRAVAAPYQYLHADATDHENYHLQHAPIAETDDHHLDDAALERMLDTYLDPAIDFFDVFLKESAPIESVPRVRWHLGHVGYRSADSWPPTGAARQHWYLVPPAGADDGAADAADGELSAERPTAAARWAWCYDPANLVPSGVVNSFAFLYEFPDERPWRDHEHVLVFAGPVVDDPIDLAGPIELQLRVTTTAPTTDVFAKLCDLAPDGTLRQIVRGQILLRDPDDATTHTIDMGHTGYRVRSGHRVQLLLSSSDFPEHPPNSGTEEDRWLAASRRGSEQQLITDQVAPSALVVTVLPSGA